MAPDEHEAPLPTGARVALRGGTWLIASRTPYADCAALRVIGCGAAGATLARTFLLPFDRPRRLDTRATVRIGTRRRYLHALRRLVTGAHPFGGLRTVAGARIALMPFQLEPALAMLRHGHLRVLIADEVGLGKTVQAAVVLSELAAQDDGFRALVACPAGLREQWRAELSVRFSLSSTIADTPWLARATRDLPPDVNPWSLPGTYISSLDFVKQPEVLRALEDVRWDALVVDEVHGAAPGTARLLAAQALGRRSRRVLLMTATPPEGEPAHMEAIAGIGRLDSTEALAVFRRTRTDAGLGAVRKTVLLPVRLTGAERHMHRLLEQYTRLVWQEAAARHDARARLVAVLLRKRALSGATPLAATLGRRITAVGRDSQSPGVAERGDPPVPALLPFDDAVEDAVPDEIVAAPGLSNVAHERALLERLAAAAERASRAESKLASLRRLLARVQEPVVIFTEYRDTLAHLAAALSDARPVLLHGAMPPVDRAAAQHAFNDGATLLLATDAASEGLNLHHRCRTVVHFELPWVPMRLEQRTGRVNRLGQTRRVHEILLVARHTCERLVLAPLVRRIRAAGGRSRLTSLAESTIAAAVLQNEQVQGPPVEPASAGVELSLRDEAADESRRIFCYRQLGSGRTGGLATPPRDLLVHVDGEGTSAAALVRLTLERADGRLVHDDLVPVHCCVVLRDVPRTTVSARQLASELVERYEAELCAACSSLRRDAFETARTRASALFERLSSRERRMAPAEAGSRTLVQAGLFDRRAVAEAESRARAAAALLTESQTRIAALASGDLQPRARIVAVHVGWPFPR